MRIFENQEFHSDDFDDRDSSALFCDIEFRRCYFQSFTLSITCNPALRTTVRNVQLIGCSQRGCRLDCAIVEDVQVDGFKTNGLFQTVGAVFNRVMLRGKIDRLMISNDVSPATFLTDDQRQCEIATFRKANAGYYHQVEWALDISRGEFKELDIRGVPTQLIRRDPETQVVVTRQNASSGKWKKLKLQETLWQTSIGLFLESDESSTILVAPKRHPKFRNYLEDLRLLQKAGVAEPD